MHIFPNNCWLPGLLGLFDCGLKWQKKGYEVTQNNSEEK